MGKLFMMGLVVQVESRGAIMLRPSLLDRSVRVSPHCAPEYL